MLDDYLKRARELVEKQLGLKLPKLDPGAKVRVDANA
jgi:hypothetical protein